MFSPGETIAHQFIIPFVVGEITKVIVSYKQGDNIVLEKPITSGFEAVSGKTKVTITFSQQESLLFKECSDVRIQLNVITTGGSRCTSKEIRETNGVQHLKEVIH